MTNKISILINITTNFMMLGVIWFIQLVHLPLFSYVAGSHFSQYISIEAKRTLVLIALPMILELAATLYLLLRKSPAFNALSLKFSSILVAVIWGVAILAVLPSYGVLGEGFHTVPHNLLQLFMFVLATCWTAKAVIAIMLVSQSASYVKPAKSDAAPEEPKESTSSEEAKPSESADSSETTSA
ncbi:hypothetical protein HOH87_01895 [bacterium]|jgi:hypothetical protein|nr:hypothetical protein [bacterium]